MSYSEYLKPRKDTLSEEGIEGIIDLANLTSTDSRKIEANPKLFFELTYPTSDILRVLEQLHIRFESNKDTSGLFLFEGLKSFSFSQNFQICLSRLFKELFLKPGIIFIN